MLHWSLVFNGSPIYGLLSRILNNVKISQNEIRQIQHEEKEKQGTVKKIRGILDRIDERLVETWETT